MRRAFEPPSGQPRAESLPSLQSGDEMLSDIHETSSVTVRAGAVHDNCASRNMDRIDGLPILPDETSSMRALTVSTQNLTTPITSPQPPHILLPSGIASNPTEPSHPVHPEKADPASRVGSPQFSLPVRENGSPLLRPYDTFRGDLLQAFGRDSLQVQQYERLTHVPTLLGYLLRQVTSEGDNARRIPFALPNSKHASRNLRPLKFLLLEVSRTLEDTMQSKRFMSLPVLSPEEIQAIDNFTAEWTDLQQKLRVYVSGAAMESIALDIIAAKERTLSNLNDVLLSISQAACEVSGFERLLCMLNRQPDAVGVESPRVSSPAESPMAESSANGVLSSLRLIDELPWETTLHNTRALCVYASLALYAYTSIAVSVAPVSIVAMSMCYILTIIAVVFVAFFRTRPAEPGVSYLGAENYHMVFGVILSLSAHAVMIPTVPAVDSPFELLWAVCCLLLDVNTVHRRIFLLLRVFAIAAFWSLRVALVQEDFYSADPDGGDMQDGPAGLAIAFIGRILGIAVVYGVIEFLHKAAKGTFPRLERTLKYEQQYRLTALTMIDNYMNDGALEDCLRDVNHEITALLSVAQTTNSEDDVYASPSQRDETYATSILSKGLTGLKDRIDCAFQRSPLEQSVRTNATFETQVSMDGGLRSTRSRGMSDITNPLAGQSRTGIRESRLTSGPQVLSASARSNPSASPKQSVNKIRTLLGATPSRQESIRLSPQSSDLRRSVAATTMRQAAPADIAARDQLKSPETRPASALGTLRGLISSSKHVDEFLVERDGSLFIRVNGTSFSTPAGPMLGTVALLAVELPDLTITYWSPKLEHLTGFKRDDIEKRSIYHLIDDEGEQARLERACQEAMSGLVTSPLAFTLRGDCSETMLMLSFQPAYAFDDSNAGPIVIASGRDLGYEHVLSQYLTWLFDSIRAPIHAMSRTADLCSDPVQYQRTTQQLVEGARKTLARFEPLCSNIMDAAFLSWGGVNLKNLLEKVLLEFEERPNCPALTLDFPDDVSAEVFLDGKRIDAVTRSLVGHFLRTPAATRDDDASVCGSYFTAGVVVAVAEERASGSSTLRLSIKPERPKSPEMQSPASDTDSRLKTPSTAFTIDKTDDQMTQHSLPLPTPSQRPHPSCAASSASLPDLNQTVTQYASAADIFSPQSGPEGLALAHVRLIVRQMGGNIHFRPSLSEFVVQLPCMYATMSDQPALVAQAQQATHRVQAVTSLVYIPSVFERRFVLQALWKLGLSTTTIEDPVDTDGLALTGIDIFVVSHGKAASDAILSRVIGNKQMRDSRVLVLRNPDEPLVQRHTELYSKKKVTVAMQPIKAAQLRNTLLKLHDEVVEKKKKQQDEATLRKTFGNGHSCPWARLSKLGKGAFSEVYKAVNLLTNGLMAVKVIQLDGKTEAGILNMVNEIKLLSDHRHENIIHYFYCERTASELHIFMEYSPGGSLNDLIMQYDYLDKNTTVCCLVDILSAVRYLHSQNVIHRDIKSANILLTADGTCKLSDFGCAIHPGKDELIQTFVGTPSYMAPEVVNEKPYTCVVDCWSVGVLTYEMLTGSMLWREVGMNWMKIAQHIGKIGDGLAEVRFPEGDHIDAEERSFILLCLTVEPEQRATSEELCKHPFLSTYSRDDMFLPVVPDEETATRASNLPPLPNDDDLSSTLSIVVDTVVGHGHVVSPSNRRFSMKDDRDRGYSHGPGRKPSGLNGTDGPAVVRASAARGTESPTVSNISSVLGLKQPPGNDDEVRKYSSLNVALRDLRSEPDSGSSSTSSNASVISFVSKSQEVSAEKLRNIHSRNLRTPRSDAGYARGECPPTPHRNRNRSPSHSPRRKSAAPQRAEEWTIDAEDDEVETLPV